LFVSLLINSAEIIAAEPSPLAPPCRGAGVATGTDAAGVSGYCGKYDGNGLRRRYLLRPRKFRGDGRAEVDAGGSLGYVPYASRVEDETLK